MSSYSKEQFKKELRKYGLNPTPVGPKEARLWIHGNGKLLCLDETQNDYSKKILDDILDFIGIPYRN